MIAYRSADTVEAQTLIGGDTSSSIGSAVTRVVLSTDKLEASPVQNDRDEAITRESSLIFHQSFAHSPIMQGSSAQFATWQIDETMRPSIVSYDRTERRLYQCCRITGVGVAIDRRAEDGASEPSGFRSQVAP